MLNHKRIHAVVGATVTAAALAVTGVAASAAVARPARPVTPGHTALTKIVVAMNGRSRPRAVVQLASAVWRGR